jgi:hypothetical protein
MASDLQLRVQSALDDDRADVAFDLLRDHAAGAVDVQLLNDMAVIAHAGGETAKAVDLLRAATVIAPERTDLKENLGVLEADDAPEFVVTGGGDKPLVPHMTAEELGLLQAVGGHRRFVLEFGCGGSTAEWLRLGVERVISIESDAAWVTELRDHPELAGALASKQLTLVHANVGPTGDWGAPKGEMQRWPGYWSKIWELPGVTATDLVFVYGRFRVASALNAALHVAPGVPIVMHDFSGRPHYHAVLAHLDVVALAGSLAVLQRRADFDPARVVDAIARHALDLR